jgi:hypothetical protein
MNLIKTTLSVEYIGTHRWVRIKIYICEKHFVRLYDFIVNLVVSR